MRVQILYEKYFKNCCWFVVVVYKQTEVDIISDIDEYQTWPGWLVLVSRYYFVAFFNIIHHQFNWIVPPNFQINDNALVLIWTEKYNEIWTFSTKVGLFIAFRCIEFGVVHLFANCGNCCVTSEPIVAI